MLTKKIIDQNIEENEWAVFPDYIPAENKFYDVTINKASLNEVTKGYWFTNRWVTDPDKKTPLKDVIAFQEMREPYVATIMEDSLSRQKVIHDREELLKELKELKSEETGILDVIVDKLK